MEGIHITRVRATNRSEAASALARGELTLDGGSRLRDPSMGNLGLHQAHEMGVFTLGEVACTMSHLRAMRRAHEAGQALALIVEDDASFTHHSAWDVSLEALASAAPVDWEVLQLHTNNILFYNSSYCRAPCGATGSDLFVPWNSEMWSTLAYVINRAGMSKLLRLTANATRLPREVAADLLIYNLTTTYTLARPLFSNILDASTIQDRRAQKQGTDQVCRCPHA